MYIYKYLYQHFSKDTRELRRDIWEKILVYRWQNKHACLTKRPVVVTENDCAS